MAAEPTVLLKSLDGMEFQASVEAIKASGTINTMLEDIGNDDKNAIPVPISSSTLEIILKWCNHHKNDPVFVQPDEDTVRKAKIAQWDQSLLLIETPRLFELVQAANLLEIQHLYILCCKTIANMMKGHSKDPKYIREMFQLPDDLPSDRVRMDMMWDEEEEDDSDAITL